MYPQSRQEQCDCLCVGEPINCFYFSLCCRDWNFILCRGCGKEGLQHHHQQLEGHPLVSHGHQQNCRLERARGLPNGQWAPASNGMRPPERWELRGQRSVPRQRLSARSWDICTWAEMGGSVLFCFLVVFLLLVRWNRPNIGLMETASLFETWKL